MIVKDTKELHKQQYKEECIEEINRITTRTNFLHGFLAVILVIEIVAAIVSFICVCVSSTPTNSRVYEYGRWVTKPDDLSAIFIAIGIIGMSTIVAVFVYNLILHFIYAASYVSKNSICQMYKQLSDLNGADLKSVDR